MRLFVALALPDAVRFAFAELIAQLQTQIALRPLGASRIPARHAEISR